MEAKQSRNWTFSVVVVVVVVKTTTLVTCNRQIHL